MKKQNQLGMNPSTASNRLVKDILFSLVQKNGHSCFQCGMAMTRQNFTIEHKVPWLDSDDPVKMFFDLDNIAFSHHKCNVAEKRYTGPATQHATNSMYIKGCRCDLCKEAHRLYARSTYTSERRAARYGRNGK